MVFFNTFLLFVLLAVQAGGQTIRLQSGVPRRFSIASQSQPFVLTGLTIQVPGGSSRLTIELEPDVSSHDLTLWARFGRDVATQGGAVTAADFSAHTIGTGRERVVITSASSPPLQTGLYYIAIGVVTLDTPISGTITATVEGGGATGTMVISTFDFEAEGWTINFPESNIPGSTLGDPNAFLEWVNAGGMPGGFLRMTDANSNRQSFAVAPRKFLGNLRAMTNPRIEFDFRHTSGPEAIFNVRLLILGAGSAFVWDSPEPPSPSWTHYRVPLNTDSLRRASGTSPLAQVLSDVERIEISMDQAIGGMESNGLDNFALIGDLPGPPPSAAPTVPTRSTFDENQDGWSRNYPPVAIRGSSFGDAGSVLLWATDAGIPGGALEYREEGSGADDFFVAPPKFLGNLAAIPNPRLEFDYRHVAQPSGIVPLVVRLVGAGASFLFFGAIPAPFGQYQHYRVPLAGEFFVRESGTASFAQMLTAVERIEISADHSPAAEVNFLDNVELLSSATPPVRPSLATSAAGLTFTGTAEGPNPPAQDLRITSSGDGAGVGGGGGLAWTATVEPPSPWLIVSPLSGATPGVVTVSVNTAGLSPGTLSARIVIAATGAANSPQVVTVSLTVTPSPASLPRVGAGGVVNAASFRGPVAPGSLASIFGSNLGPADGLSSVFLPGTQTLPTRFRGVRVLVRETGGAQIAEAPLLFVSGAQINFQMPFEVAGRAAVQIVVDNDGLLSAPETVALTSTAPGLFTHGVNRAVVQNQDFSLNTPANPAPRGGILIAYLTGQGAIVPAVPTGQAAPLDPISRAVAGAAATIGTAPATVLFFGLTPGLVGLAQANILVPEAAPSGDQVLLISIGGQVANGALVSIAP